MNNNWKRLPRVVFDTETTGLGPEARIVEIAACSTAYGFFASLIRPVNINWDDPSVVEAMKVNGIDRFGPLLLAPTFEQRWETLSAAFDGSDVWVGHFVDFDIRMVQQELQRVGKKLQMPKLRLDTVILDFGLNPGCESYRLDDVRKRWNISEQNLHRAQGDTTVCSLVLEAMTPKLPDDLEQMAQLQALWADRWKERKAQRDAKRKAEKDAQNALTKEQVTS